jgi:hypothetical protein
MKALVVKVEYIANHDEAKEPVMKLQVPKSLLSRTTDESNEAQQTHLNQLPTRVELEPLHMGASDEWTHPRSLIFRNIDALIDGMCVYSAHRVRLNRESKESEEVGRCRLALAK